MVDMAVVAHHFWGTLGGGELVNASAAVSLRAVYDNVVLSGVFKFDKSKYSAWFGIELSDLPAVVLFPFKANIFGVMSRALAWVPALKAVKRYKTRLLWFGAGAATYGPLVPYRKRGLKIVEYIHFPLEAVFDEKLSHLLYGAHFIRERYGSFPLNVYWKVSGKLIRRYARSNPCESADSVLANSKWTLDVVNAIYGKCGEVLNPPISPNTEIVKNPKSFEARRPAVVMLGRFSHEKRYREVVEIFPRVLKEVPDARLYLIGAATSKTAREYVDFIRRLVAKKGLQKNVIIHADAPRRLVVDLMDSARAFLHATINEHWGIAAAEAMARGLPVVVHRSGGVWTDLAGEGAFGLGYQDLEEAAELLAKLLTDSKFWSFYSERSIRRAEGLIFENFRRRVAEIVSRLA